MGLTRAEVSDMIAAYNRSNTIEEKETICKKLAEKAGLGSYRIQGKHLELVKNISENRFYFVTPTFCECCGGLYGRIQGHEQGHPENMMCEQDLPTIPRISLKEPE